MDKNPWEEEYTGSATTPSVVSGADSTSTVDPWQEEYTSAPQSIKPLSPAKQGVVMRQKADVFNGSRYTKDSKKNEELYNSVGRPLNIFGVDIPGVRIQNTTNAAGEERTMFVPPPLTNSSPAEPSGGPVSDTYGPPTVKDVLKDKYDRNEFGPQSGGGPARMITGGLLETIKGSVDLAGFLIKGGADPSLNMTAKAIDDMLADFDKNFPTMPAANNFEKVVQELIPAVVGFAGGAKLGVETLKLSKEMIKDTPQYVEWLSKQYKQFMADGKDPIVAMKKLELLVKVGVSELSGNAGIAALSPEDMQGFSSGPIQELLKGQNILSKEELNKVGIFVDNTAFSIGLAWAGKLIGGGTQVLKDIWSKVPSEAQAPAAILSTLISAVDSGIAKDAPKEEVARRLSILGEVVLKNKEFAVDLLGETVKTELDATTSLMMGAEDYVRQVYADQLRVVPPAMGDTFVAKKAQEFMENLSAVKRTLKNNPNIASSEANVIDGFSTTLTNTSDKIAEGKPVPASPADEEFDLYKVYTTPAKTRAGLPLVDPSNIASEKNSLTGRVVAAAGESLAKPVADALNTAVPKSSKSSATLAAIDDTQKTATLTRLLTDARKQGLVNDTALENVVTSELPKLKQIDKANMEKGFDQIPAIPIAGEDAMALAEAIKAAGDQKGLMNLLRLAPGELDPVGKIANDYVDADGVAHSPVADLAKQIEEAGIDLPTLVNQVRPLLAQLKDRVWTNPSRMNRDTGPLDSMIKFIEDMAKDEGKQFGAAMDGYKRYADKWLNTDALKAFDAADSAVRPVKTEGDDGLPVTEFGRNQPQATVAAMKAYEDSATALTDAPLKKFLEAISDPAGANVPAIRKALVGRALYQISRKPVGSVTAGDIENAVRPLLKELEAAGGQEDIRMFNDAIEQLHLAENGMGDIEKASADAVFKSEEIIKNANLDAAIDLVYKGPNGARPRDPASIAGVFNDMFRNKDSLETIPKLLARAKADGNQLAVDGIKAQFLRFIQEETGIKKAVGLKVGKNSNIPIEAVRDLSGTKLANIFETDGNLTLPLLAKIYADDPKTGQGLVSLLQVMHSFMNGRTASINLFGSNTAVDTAQMSKLLNVGITLMFGVLNPTAAKIRGVSKLAIESGSGKKGEAQAVVEFILSRMVTEPKFLSDSATMLSTQMGEELWKKQNKMAMENALAHGLFNESPIHQTKEEETENVDVQTKGAFPL